MPVDLKILLATAEVFPLAKTGGLADVCASLPAALRDLGLDARILTPAYRGSTGELAAKPVGKPFQPMAGAQSVRLLKGTLPGTRVPVYLVHCPELYDRPGDPYCDQYGNDHPDNAIRFGVLSKVAALFGTGAGRADWKADVIHGHDWHCGLASAYLKFDPQSTAASVFTIHNLAYQGNFDRKVRRALGIDSLAFHMDGLEFYGHLSFMKSGIFYADEVTTVSPRYATEIQDSAFGFGMDGVLRSRVNNLTGVLNGIDTDSWDPTSDVSIAANFSVADLAPRDECRRDLLQDFGMDAAADQMVIGMLGRMSPQKGWELLLGAAPVLLSEGLRMMLVGHGSRAYVRKIKTLQAEYPGQIGFFEGFNEAVAHRMISGVDVLAIPSVFEPCGLVQMYAQRFGTLPVAHRTGGLADSILDPADLSGEPATGFLFDAPTESALVAALQRAARLRIEDRGQWHRMQRAAMNTDFGWQGSASRYADVYQSAFDTRLKRGSVQ
ncbi:MAG: glycogen synthase GlgA [Gammaproteobacteria bacterium]|nr:MAG: glycogen synthase GlgA [Gammaproteobacteria bacterium]